MPIDTRREMQHIWDEYARYYNQIGEEVVWFRFDTVESRWDDIYDEGGKTYLTGIRTPILWVDQIEDPEQYSGEGRRPTQRIRFAVSSVDLARRGISTYEAHGNMIGQDKPAAPSPAQIGRPTTNWLDDRLNDVIFYDQRYWAVSNFQIRGRLKSQDMIIGVAALELNPEDESVFDFFPWDDASYTPAVDVSQVDTLDIVVSALDDVEIYFRDETTQELLSLIGTWESFATSDDGTQPLPVDFSQQENGLLLLDIRNLDIDKFPYYWWLTQITDDGTEYKVYQGTIFYAHEDT